MGNSLHILIFFTLSIHCGGIMEKPVRVCGVCRVVSEIFTEGLAKEKRHLDDAAS
jgi:hypothetical protein